MPLADSDIFKSKLYNYYSSINKKENFIEKWKKLETKVHSIKMTMDDLFNNYMFFERAKQGISNNTVEGLRTFYEKNSRLLNEEIFYLN